MKKLNIEILTMICMSLCMFMLMGGTHGIDQTFNSIKVNNVIDVDSAYCFRGHRGINFDAIIETKAVGSNVFSFRHLIICYEGGIVTDTSWSEWFEWDTQQ